MTDTLEFQSRVGKDGVLDLHVPLGQADAGVDVVVTIRRVSPIGAAKFSDPALWHQLANDSYGSCADSGLERPPQGQFDTREPIE